MGDVTVRMEFEADEPKPATGGEVTLFIDGRPVGKGRMDHSVPIRFRAIRLSTSAGTTVARRRPGTREKPFAFTGTVEEVVFDLKPHLSDQDGSISMLPGTTGKRGTPLGMTLERKEVSRCHRERDDGRSDRRYLSTEAAHEDYEAVLNCGARLWGAVIVSKDMEGNAPWSRPITWSRKARGCHGWLRSRPLRTGCSPPPRSVRRSVW